MQDLDPDPVLWCWSLAWVENIARAWTQAVWRSHRLIFQEDKKFSMCKSPVPHIPSLLHTTTAWGSTRKEMKTGKIKSKYGKLQLCWLQLAKGTDLWAPKRKGASPCRGCLFTPSSLVGLSLAKHFFFGLSRGRKSDMCCFPWGSVLVYCMSHKPMLWPSILFPIQSLGAASMGKLAPVGKPSSTAALHPPCSSEKLWVRSAKAAYSTTGDLSNRTAD